MAETEKTPADTIKLDAHGRKLLSPDDSPETFAEEIEAAAGAPGPTAWWRYGIVALAVVIAVLLALQFLGGNKGTDVIPGTPVAAPQQTN
jgi:hypothetical protein